MATLADIIKKRKRKKALEEDPNLLVLEKIDKLNEKIEEVAEEIEEVKKKVEQEDLEFTLPQEEIDKFKGDKGDSVKGDKGDTIKGDSGEDYILTAKDKKEIASKIKVPIVKKIIEKTEVIKEIPIITNEIKEIAITDKPEEIANKLNTLEEKVNISVIKGLIKRFERLERLIQDIKRTSKNFGAKGLGGGSLVESEDLSSQCDGSNVTFTVNSVIKDVMILSGTQFPIIYRKGIDFTFSGKIITLTLDNFAAPEDDQTLHVVYTR